MTISCLKCYLASFSRCKTAFSPYILPHKHAEQDQIDAKWLERVGRSLIGPRQANLVLIAYASSEGSGEPAHPRSLARTFAARSYKQWVKRNLQTESQIPGPSEWLGMLKFVMTECSKTQIRLTQLSYDKSIKFYFTHEHQNLYFHCFSEIKFDLTLTKSNILYKYTNWHKR